MRSRIGGAVAALSCLGAASAYAQLPGPWRLALGPEEKVDLSLLNNAPNGHISYETGNGTLTVWVAGRLPSGQRGVKGTTGGSGWLYYSRNEGTQYVGYRRTFSIASSVARMGPLPAHTPRRACAANGGTWYGGRCH